MSRRDYLVVNVLPKHRVTRRAHSWVMRALNTENYRLGKNYRQWFILSEGEPDCIGAKGFYALHRVTRIKAWIAATDVEQLQRY